MLCLHSPREGSKGKELENARVFLLAASRLANPIVCSLQASTRFARFGLPLTHFKEKGLFVISPYEGLDGYPSGTLQNPSTGRIFGQSTVLRLTADGNGSRYR